MDRSYPYSRRLATRARLRQRMGVVTVTALAAACALLLSTWAPAPLPAVQFGSPSAAASLAGLAGQADARQPGGVRRIYPYSVIPGGVAGGTELARVIRSDRVVAVHYASFDVAKARAVVVAKPRAVYVSYRKGDQVYWTARKVMLAAGETLLTDGRNDMRARCANRISDVPQYPVEAHRPAMEELDNPVELAEGEQGGLEADALPVAMPWVEDTLGHAGPGFVGLKGGGGSAAAQSSLAADRHAPRPAAAGMPFTTALMASLNSLGSRPTPAVTPALPATPGSPLGPEGSGSAPGAPEPAGSSANPGSDPAAAGGSDNPGATPPLETESAPPADAQQSGGGGTEALPPAPPADPGPPFPPPEPDTTALIPPPVLLPDPAPPRGGADAAAPPAATVPEPASIWLAGTALALMAALRRRGRGAPSQAS